MSDTLQSTTSVAIARELAASHAGASLPCPLCSATLKASNLERHLGKVHPEQAQASGPRPTGPLKIRGIDRGMVMPGIVGLVLWGVGACVVLVLNGPKLDPVPLAIFGSTGLALFGIAAAAFAGSFKATLEIEADTLRVRWLLGLASKSVALPAKIETGSLVRQQLSNINQDNVVIDSHEVRAGTYLRLGSITIGCEGAAGLGRHWAQKGWSKGKKTKRTDIDIEREGMVALEYQLAGRGQLLPKQ